MKDFANIEEYKTLRNLDISVQYKTEYKTYKFKTMQETEFEWVETGERLKEIASEIEDALSVYNVLAVDLEYHNVQRQATVLSLIQLSTYRKDYIIDSLQLRDLSFYDSLRPIFENKKYVKILHGGDTDI